jgi:heterodisulfide reductase subunit C
MDVDYQALKLTQPGVMPKSERELRASFLAQLELIPGGDKIKACIQCGTCTGSCPVSYAMDISPRGVMALFRAGDIESILRSRTIWVCASCYVCTTRCPSGIKITDILYALKRIAMDKGIFPSRFPVYALSEQFVKMVNKYGRNYELGLVVRFNLKTGWKKFLEMAPLGWKMFRHGRLAFKPTRIKGLEQIRKIISQAEKASVAIEREIPEYASPVGYGVMVEVSKDANRAGGGD